MAYNIDILLAVYNGEKYLEELLQSILNQSCTDWRLIIRNDGSRDGSSLIAAAFAYEQATRVRRPPELDRVTESFENAGSAKPAVK